jgi:hypothetical protein
MPQPNPIVAGIEREPKVTVKSTAPHVDNLENDEDNARHWAKTHPADFSHKIV